VIFWIGCDKANIRVTLRQQKAPLHEGECEEISAIWCKVNVSQFGFPPEFLKEYNHDSSWDFLTTMHYFPAIENENNGISEH
jgi:hypothetical protein